MHITWKIVIIAAIAGGFGGLIGSYIGVAGTAGAFVGGGLLGLLISYVWK